MKKFNPDSIRVLRLTKNMTLEEFAQSLGDTVSKQLVSQWELARHIPSVGSLLRICDVHKVPLEIFFIEI